LATAGLALSFGIKGSRYFEKIRRLMRERLTAQTP
jgi:hypothetical protein